MSHEPTNPVIRQLNAQLRALAAGGSRPAGDSPRRGGLCDVERLLASAAGDTSGEISELVSQIATLVGRARDGEPEYSNYRVYADAAPDGIFVVDGHGRYIDANPAACRMTGFTREELLAMSIPELADTDRDPKVLSRFSELLAVGQLRAETYLRRKTGDSFPVSLDAVALPGDQYMAFCSDISDRRMAERELRKSEERYRSIFDTAANAITSVDGTGIIVACNRRIEDLLGYTPEEVVGQSMTMIIHPDYHAKAGRSLERILTEGVLYGREYKFVRKDGGIIDVRVNAAGLREGNGTYTRTICILDDITELRRTREQLLQAQKMESVGRLASGVAHDFNNLLTIMLSSCSFLEDDLSPSDPAAIDVREIREAAERAAELTRQLLALGRRQVLQTRILDINEVVGSFDRMIRRVIGEDVDLQTHMPRRLWPVEADAGQIGQILMNLAVNARDAMPQGGRLRIEAENVDLAGAETATLPGLEPGRHVRITVADTGQGMDADTLERALEPFFTTKRRGEGTGLGLSTVYGIVTQHGGCLAIASSPEAGTTVRIYLPAAIGEETSISLRILPRPEEVEGKTILVVEDEPSVLRLTVRALEREGYVVLQARDGLQALSVAADHPGPIHLLLTDVVLPDGSGMTSAAEMAEARPDLRVLFMTGYSEEAAIRRSGRDRELEVLQKPFTARSLCDAVLEALRKPSDGLCA